MTLTGRFPHILTLLAAVALLSTGSAYDPFWKARELRSSSAGTK